jgi:hypothetical protein
MLTSPRPVWQPHHPDGRSNRQTHPQQHHRQQEAAAQAEPAPGHEGPSGGLPIRGEAPASPVGRQTVLGTWAQRLYKLPLPGSNAAAHKREGKGLGAGASWAVEAAACSSGGSSGTAAARASLAQPIPKVAPAAAAAAVAGPVRGEEGEEEDEDEDEEEAVARAAWRWRFAKRWAAEQARQLDPAASMGDGGDGVEELIAYLAAGGAAGPMDMERTVSEGDALGSAGSAARLLAGSMSLLGQEGLLVGEMSRNGSFSGSVKGGGGCGSRRGSRVAGGGGGGVATRELSAAARRAARLLAAQADLDRAAADR